MLHPDYTIKSLLDMNPKLQTVLHWLSLVALVGVAVEPKLFDLAPKSQHVTEFILAALNAFNFYADVIFVKQQEPPIPTPGNTSL